MQPHLSIAIPAFLLLFRMKAVEFKSDKWKLLVNQMLLFTYTTHFILKLLQKKLKNTNIKSSLK